MSGQEIVTREAGTVAPVENRQGTGLLAVIASAATNPQCDIEKMRALLEMQAQLEEKQAQAEFAQALSRASSVMPQVIKRGIASLGGKGSYNYAKWEDMDEKIRPILSENQLSLSFTSKMVGNSLLIIGSIIHANGQSRESEMLLPIDSGPGRSPLQQHGSSLSYGKRYVTEMLLNIVRRGEDNDAAPPPQKQFISAAQKEEIVGLMQETGADTKKLLAWAGYATLDVLPVSEFDRVRNKLLQKLKEQLKKLKEQLKKQEAARDHS